MTWNDALQVIAVWWGFILPPLLFMGFMVRENRHD